MKQTETTIIETVGLSGLTTAPSQVCGAIRLAPILRPNAPGDLRLARRKYDEDLAIVGLDHRLAYLSYIPHGLVLSWTDDGHAVVANGSQLGEPDGIARNLGVAKVRYLKRMAQREAGNALRMLPLHLAMEGFLSLQFSGPDIAWTEYSRRALREGLDPRWEMTYGGESIAGFANALRVFEIHEHQVGVLVFVADALASAFVVSTPDDYRSLHQTLLADFYGELIWQYATMYDTVATIRSGVDDSKIEHLRDLRAAIARVRQDWAEFQEFMAGDLLGRPVKSTRVYQAGPFTLQRFITDLDPSAENHFGEAIVRDDGTLEYLKTYRLSASQARRAYLLSQLAAADWNVDDAAGAMQTTRDELVLRLDKAGFGYLMAEPVRVAAAKHARQLRKRFPYEK